MVLRAILLFCAPVLFAQSSAPAKPQSAGLEANWQIAPVIEEIAAHAGRLLPALDKFDPSSWVAKGASETYVAQLQSSKEQAKALNAEAKDLARNPERLSASLTVLFRVQGIESMLRTLSEAVAKYQSPADAQALLALVAENGAGRNRLQMYVVNLAAEREHDLAVMDQEAQRCRAAVPEPAPRKPGGKK
jgi:hypothetical protein